jgi:hypothetical protein
VGKLNKNESGFSIVEAVLVLLIVALIGTIGYLVYKDHHKNLGQVTGKWVSYTSPKGNFSANFPTSPNFNKNPIVIPQTSKSKNGVNYTINGVLSSSVVSQTNYTVIYLTYPSTNKVPTLSSVVNDTLHNNQFQVAHLISSKKLSVNGNQAESYEITVSTNGLNFDLTGEVVSLNKVIYQVQAQVPGTTETANAQYFVNSFKIGQ